MASRIPSTERPISASNCRRKTSPRRRRSASVFSPKPWRAFRRRLGGTKRPQPARLARAQVPGASAERVRLPPKVRAGLPPAVGEDEEAVARDDGGGDDARGVEKAGGRESYYDGPDAQGPRLYGGGPRDGGLD